MKDLRDLKDSMGLLAPLRMNWAQITQSGPDSGHGFQVKVLKTIQVVASSLKNGTWAQLDTARIGQSGPESTPGFQVQVLKTV